MPDDVLELVKLRNNFYRDNYRRAIVAVLLCILIIFVLIGAIYLLYSQKPEPKYFATTADGRILPLVPINLPYKTDPEILQWAANAALVSNSYDFVNYRKQLQDAAQFFTPAGWVSYMQALQQSNNLIGVKEGHIILTSTPTGAPQILDRGLISGAYYWKIGLPLLLSYTGQSLAQTQKVYVTMTILRVSTLDNPTGIGIAQMVVEQQTN